MVSNLELHPKGLVIHSKVVDVITLLEHMSWKTWECALILIIISEFQMN